MNGEALEPPASSPATGELPLLAWHGITRRDREQALAVRAGLGLAAAAAATAAGRPDRAVLLVEHGRNVLWAQLLASRAHLTALQAADRRLADRLTAIHRDLDRP